LPIGSSRGGASSRGCRVVLSAFGAVLSTSIKGEAEGGASPLEAVSGTPSVFCCCPVTSSSTSLVFVFVAVVVVVASPFCSFASTGVGVAVVCVVASFAGGGST